MDPDPWGSRSTALAKSGTLIQVKRKTLCSWAPFSLVQPEILPGDLARPGGVQILQSIRELTAEVGQHTYIQYCFLLFVPTPVLRIQTRNISLGPDPYRK